MMSVIDCRFQSGGRLFFWLMAFLISGTTVFADVTAPVAVNLSPDRRVAPLHSVFDLRRDNETRVWSYTVNKTDIGRLLSRTTVTGSSLTLNTELRLNYTKVQQERQLLIRSETEYGPDGEYRRDKIDINADGNAGQLSWERTGNTLALSSSSGGASMHDRIPLLPSVHAWEPYLVDQLELFLALRPIHVGDSIIDSVFQPQGRTVVPVRGDVPYFMWQELWKGKIDSVFIIRLNAPMNAQLYYTADRRLVRVDFPDENMRVYQDAILTSPTTNQPSLWSSLTSKIGSIRLVSLTVATILFLPVLAGVWFFARRGCARPDLSSQAALFGLLSGLFFAIVQPVVSTWVILGVKQTGAVLTGIASSLIVALLTVGVLALGLVRVVRIAPGSQAGNVTFWGAGLLFGFCFGGVNAVLTLAQGVFGLFTAATTEQLLLTFLLALFGGVLIAMKQRSQKQYILCLGLAALTLTLWRVVPSVLLTTGLNTGGIIAFYLILTVAWWGAIVIFRLFPAAPSGKRPKAR